MRPQARSRCSSTSAANRSQSCSLAAISGSGWGAAGLAKTYCDAHDADCAANGMHVGVEAQYHVLPAAAVDPWLGDGLGLETLALTASKNDATSTISATSLASSSRASRQARTFG